MKSVIVKLVFACAAMFVLNVALAQENQSRFLQEAINALREGDCQRALDNYDMAKNLDSELFDSVTGANVEKAIALCFENEAKGSATDSPKVHKDSVFTCDYLDYYFYMDNLAMTYDRAELAAKGSKYANHSDWRIPTIEELQLIIDYHCSINSDFPQNVIRKNYWSSTSNSSSYNRYYYGYNYGKNSCSITDLDNKKYCVYVRNNKNASSEASSKAKKKK